MNGDEGGRTGFAAWVEAHPVETVVGGLTMLGLLAFLISSLGGNEPTQGAFATTSTTAVEQGGIVATTEPVSRDEVERPDVPQLNCATLITNDEADAAIFGDVSGPRGLFTFTRGETCVFDPDDGSGAFVVIEPGSPDDLATGGGDVGGVGDVAAWSDDAVAGSGGLTVGVDSDLGALVYRIVVSRPDLDGTARLEIARGLALAALPRFPGVTIAEPEIEQELISFPDEPVDLPTWGLDDALFGGVESGQWTLGEGLVAILSAIADGTSADVAGEDLAETSASLVIAAAQGYVAGGSDDADLIEQLLDELYLTGEELDQLAPAEETALSRFVVATALLLARQETGDECGTGVDNPCYAEVALDGYEDIKGSQYGVYVALPSKWTQTEVQAAEQALHDSALVFESLGDMPPTALILNPGDSTYALYRPSEEACRATAGDFLAGRDPGELKQIFARELSLCLIEKEAYGQLIDNPNPVRWLVYGLANYLSGVVYPSTNLEHQKLPARLAQEELSTTAPDRTWTNWILFEHLHGFMGADGIMDMVSAFPAGGDLVAALAAAPGMAELYHDLERALSDANVGDVGPGTVPYDPQAWELPIAGPSEVPFDVPRFGVRRLHIQVPAGQYACVQSFSQGAVRMSWRPGAPGEPGSWSDELPTSFEGESLMVVSSVEPGANYTLDIIDLSDDPDCQDEEPEDAGSVDPEECDLCDPSTYFWGDLVFGG